MTQKRMVNETLKEEIAQLHAFTQVIPFIIHKTKENISSEPMGS